MVLFWEALPSAFWCGLGSLGWICFYTRNTIFDFRFFMSVAGKHGLYPHGLAGWTQCFCSGRHWQMHFGGVLIVYKWLDMLQSEFLFAAH